MSFNQISCHPSRDLYVQLMITNYNLSIKACFTSDNSMGSFIPYLPTTLGRQKRKFNSIAIHFLIP